MIRGRCGRRRLARDACGVSLVELLVALALASLGLSTLAMVSAGVLGTFEAEPAAAEQQQRARAALAVMAEDLARAGGAFVADPSATPGLGLPAVVPDVPSLGAWAVGARASTVSVLSSVRSAAHARLAVAVAAGESRLVLDRPPYCSALSPTCRFTAGDHIRIADAHGAFAVALVRAATPPLVLDLTTPLAQSWPVGTFVSALDARVYGLRPDPDTGLQQLVRAGGTGSATALVDYVERFDVEWLVSGAAPAAMLAPDGTIASTTTGPAPPPAGVVGDPGWPAGENCTFVRDAAGNPASRLPGLGPEPVVAPLGRFSDGPWCPSPAAATRWDADLARVVGVRLTLTLAAADRWLRPGTAGGRGAVGSRRVPSLTVSTSIAPGRWAAIP